MKKPTRIFSFTEKDGKHFPHLDGATAFYYFETFGFPPEMYAEEMEAKFATWTGAEMLRCVENDYAIWKEEKALAEATI